MIINRPAQHTLLKQLEEHFPKALSLKRLAALVPGLDEEALFRNLIYLVGHGLIEQKVQLQPGYYSDDSTKFLVYAITSNGIDFLAADGGVAAILSTVTVKLHDDTLRALLLAKIDASVPDASTKSRLRKAVEEMSNAGLKEIGTEAVKAGIQNAPDFAHWLSGFIHHVM